MPKPTVLALLAAGCTGELTWHAHPCGNGDPVGIQCESDTDTIYEDPSTDLCEDLDVTTGDACEVADATCVAQQAYTCASMESGRSSEAFLTCRSQPFEDVGCPESSRDVKTAIHYLTPAEQEAVAQAVLDVRLARYRYKDPAKAGERLGYILEDSPDAPFSGEHRVDLYAYTSAVVALQQRQQAEIDELKARLAALETR